MATKPRVSRPGRHAAPRPGRRGRPGGWAGGRTPSPSSARGGKRWLTAAGGVIGVVAAGGVLYAAVTSSPWRLTAYTVRGSSYLTPAEVLAAAGLTMGENLFLVDCRAAERRLVATPRVRTARVTRRLPGEVTITITERPAAAALILNGELYKIADDGVLLEPMGAGYEDVPTLVGRHYRTRHVACGRRLARGEVTEALAVLAALRAVEPRWLAAVDYVDPTAREVVLGGGKRKVRYDAAFNVLAARRLWLVYTATAAWSAGELVYDVRFGNDVVVTGLRGADGPGGGGAEHGGTI